MNRRKGMTLIEMLITMVIAVVIMGMLLTAVGHVRKGAYNKRAEALLHKIDSGIQAFKADFDHYPYSWVEGDADGTDNSGVSAADDDHNGSTGTARNNRLDDDLNGTVDDLANEGNDQNDNADTRDFGEDSYMLYQVLCNVRAPIKGENCSPSKGVQEYGDYLKDEIEKELLWEEAVSGTTFTRFIDPWGTPVIYIFQTHENMVTTPVAPTSANKYCRPSRAPAPNNGFERSYELWSLGADALWGKDGTNLSLRPLMKDSTDKDNDNVTVTQYE